MTEALRTNRLTLRRFCAADAPDVTRYMQDPGVASMLTQVPWPYALSDAEEFICRYADDAPTHFAVVHDGALIGAISLAQQLGYWYARPAWGQGFATEAAQALLTRHFAASSETVVSGHLTDNPASRRVLQKLGFRDDTRRQLRIASRTEEVTLQRMTLTQSDWEAAT